MDIIDKAKRSTVGNKNYVFISLLFAACCCFVVFSGCSLPRIIVLDDPLTPQEHLTLGIAYEKKGELDPAVLGRDKLSQKWSLESEPLGGWSC